MTTPKLVPLDSKSHTSVAHPHAATRTQASLPLHSVPEPATRTGSPTQAQTARDAGTADRLLRCLHDLGYAQATTPDARALLERRGEAVLRDVVRRAKHGEAGGLATLGEWMLQQRIPLTPRVVAQPEPPPFMDLRAPVQFVPVVAPPGHTYSQPRGHDAMPGDTTRNANGTPVVRPAVIRNQVKVFGAKAALTLVADVTRAGAATVTVEAAAALGGPDRRYNWADKTRFQLTVSELQLVAALLMGYVDSVNFRNHADKWLRATRQAPGGTFAGMIQIAVGRGTGADGVTHTVAIDPTTLGSTIALFLRQAALALKLPVSVLAAVLPLVSMAHDAQSSRPGLRRP